jgi:hypothetical protein
MNGSSKNMTTSRNKTAHGDNAGRFLPRKTVRQLFFNSYTDFPHISDDTFQQLNSVQSVMS